MIELIINTVLHQLSMMIAHAYIKTQNTNNQLNIFNFIFNNLLNWDYKII